MKILHENTEYETLEIKQKYNEWNINRLCDEVIIECWDDDGNGSTALVLNQEELKTLVAFLQKQIK